MGIEIELKWGNGSVFVDEMIFNDHWCRLFPVGFDFEIWVPLKWLGFIQPNTKSKIIFSA